MSVCATLSIQSLYFSSSLKSYSLTQCARNFRNYYLDGFSYAGKGKKED